MRQGTARQQQPQQEPRDLAPVEVLKSACKTHHRVTTKGTPRGICERVSCLWFLQFVFVLVSVHTASA